MHISWWLLNTSASSITSQSLLLTGLASIAYSGHIVHVSLPMTSTLDFQVIPSVFPPSLLTYQSLQIPSTISLLGLSSSYVNPLNTGIFLNQIRAHHFYLGLVLILAGLLTASTSLTRQSFLRDLNLPSLSSRPWHAYLAFMLALLGSISIVFALSINARAYSFLSADHLTQTLLFTHHIWIGGFLIVGSSAHFSIYLLSLTTSMQLQELLNQADIIIAHLIYVTVSLGLHAFGIYVHNDTMQCLGRAEDTFNDNSIQLKPIFTLLLSSQSSLGTADFMVHHIHAFTIHTTALILMKAVLYTRSSRLTVLAAELAA